MNGVPVCIPNTFPCVDDGKAQESAEAGHHDIQILEIAKLAWKAERAFNPYKCQVTKGQIEYLGCIIIIPQGFKPFFKEI